MKRPYLTFTVVVLALLADAAWTHRCIHSHVAASQQLVELEQPVVSDGEETHQHRTMHQTSTSTSVLDQPWRPIKITFDYSIAEDPEKDKSVNGDARSCKTAGQLLKIGTPTGSHDCMKGEYVSNCHYNCTAKDVMTPATLEKLKMVMHQVQEKLQAMLMVQSALSPSVTVYHDPQHASCDGINVTRRNITNSNLGFFVTTRPLAYFRGTLAYAMACALDTVSGRPIMGTMNVSPDTIADNQDLATVLLHEATHALGFGPSMLSRFRYPGNNAKTYFQHDPTLYPTGPVSGDGVRNSGSGEFTIDYQLLGPGKKMLFIGPNTVAFAKSYYGCDTVKGVEWENGGGSSGSTASHWEKRTLFPEYMTSTQNTEKGYVSGFTLALFADMGFYKVNMSIADDMTWGRGLGCEFIDDCAKWPENYFCKEKRTTATGLGCSYNREHTAICDLATYTSALPTAYQHFSNEPTWGGKDEYADYCPIMKPVTNGNCVDPSTPLVTGAAQYYFEQQGDSSRCFGGSAIHNSYVLQQGSSRMRCYEMVCVTGGASEPSNTDGFTPLAVVNISGYFFPCHSENYQFGLNYPPRIGYASSYNFSKSEQVFINKQLVGEINCQSGLQQMCSGPGVVDIEDGQTKPSKKGLLRRTEWPSIKTVAGSVEGLDVGEVSVLGDTVTIKGRHFSGCSGATIGGLALTDVIVTPGATAAPTPTSTAATPASTATIETTGAPPPPTTLAPSITPEPTVPSPTPPPLPRVLNVTTVKRGPTVVSVYSNTTNVPVVPHPAHISSPFGPRYQNSQSRYDFHRGVDYYDELDTPIYSTANGTVFQVHWESNGTFVSGGNTIVVEYSLESASEGNATFHQRAVKKWFGYYMHLNHMNVTTVGAALVKGQQLGTMGQTGTTTFTHLHFEARLNGYCSLQYQVENNRTPSSTSYCNTGFDPHVHPNLFVGPAPSESNGGNEKSLEQIPTTSNEFVLSVRYNTTRSHLDLDVIETNFGTVSFNLRSGINATTMDSLDNLVTMTSYLSLQPGIFRHTTGDAIHYNLNFRQMPTFIELRDIYGHGIRYELSNETSIAPSTPQPTTEAPPPTTVAPTPIPETPVPTMAPPPPPAPIVIDMLVGKLGAFDGKGRGLGGYSNDDGTGDVTVELTCVVPVVCPNGCVAALAGNKVRLAMPPTTAPVPTTGTTTSTSEAPVSTTDAPTTTSATTGVSSTPTTTNSPQVTTVAPPPSTGSPPPTTSSAAPSSNPASPSPTTREAPSSTSPSTASPQPSSQPPRTTPSPTTVHPPNSVRFIVAKDKATTAKDFAGALRALMNVQNATDIIVAESHQLENGDMEVVLTFGSGAQHRSALKLTDSEKSQLGIKSAADASGPDTTKDSSGNGVELSKEAWVGIGIGIFLVVVAVGVITKKKRDSGDANKKEDDVMLGRRGRQPALQQPMLQQTQPYASPQYPGGSGMPNPQYHTPQHQQYGRAPPQYNGYQQYDEDIL